MSLIGSFIHKLADPWFTTDKKVVAKHRWQVSFKINTLTLNVCIQKKNQINLKKNFLNRFHVVEHPIIYITKFFSVRRL